MVSVVSMVCGHISAVLIVYTSNTEISPRSGVNSGISLPMAHFAGTINNTYPIKMLLPEMDQYCMAIDHSYRGVQDYTNVLLEVAHIINNAEDIDSLLSQVGEVIVDALQAYQYGAYLFETVQQQFILRVTIPSDMPAFQHFATTLDPTDEERLRQVVTQQQPIFDIPSSPHTNQSVWLLIPLTAQNQVVGVLLIGIDHKQIPLLHNLMSLIRGISHMVAVAVDNKCLRESIARRETESDRLQEVTVALLEHRTLEDVIDLVSLSLKQLIGAQHSMVFLLEDETRLRPVISSNAGVQSHPVISIEHSQIGEAVRTGKPAIRNFTGPDPRTTDWQDIAVALLAVPLQIDTTNIGVLAAIDKPGRFTADDVRIISRFAAQAAIAIEHARLARKVEHLAVVEERQRLARDLHDAVTQAVYSVTLFAQAGRQTLATKSFEDTEHYLTRIGTMAHQSLQELRLLIHELRPPTVARDGVVAALRQRLAMVEEQVGLRSRLIAELSVPLSVDVEDALYRIA
ncbi:MAG: hypothetical protein GFH27_549357n30 [Chloroflexi bacterium AL-W]|nr:hypothetical protein [Chloroflexi bacterium AL-N1]NOK70667.1 hypothetical protein [Chloroflexi bacterium AL-N10]NOK78486.1 hypothetical protein [Chloroflexi bacterium AL-N5]NOK85570.1 hypothetical protein [Chloroflexi bacterium AL-W]NOK92484.1 hypothetical protein [Chloroflexi bacterium AL-N15]